MHDRTQFEIYAFDNGWSDQSNTRKRIEVAVPNIINIRGLDDASAAAAIRESQIDILVNLNGYFGEHRTRLFAHRPAPVQVNYLGFPGTLGAPYMDYLIADQHVIPAGAVERLAPGLPTRSHPWALADVHAHLELAQQEMLHVELVEQLVEPVEEQVFQLIACETIGSATVICSDTAPRGSARRRTARMRLRSSASRNGLDT
jgi:hypothetical protein